MRLRATFPKRTSWLLIIGSTAGCGLFGGKGPPPPAPVDSVRPVPPGNRLFYDDSPGEFSDSLRIEVRDASAWRAMWDDAYKSQTDVPPIPQVDFAQQMVLLVSAGRMQPGDRISVDSVGMRGEQMVAVVRTSIGCHTFRSDIYPVEIVRVAYHEGPVSFAELRTEANCS